MSQSDLALLLGSLAACYSIAAWLAHRGGDSRRDVRLIAATAIAVGTAGAAAYAM